jgi:hypothetical protein
MPSNSDDPMHLWLQKNPKTAQQIKHSFTSSSFRWVLWSGVTTLVHNLYQEKYNEGRCQAWCGAEVLPDHTLAQPLHLPEAGSSWYEGEREFYGLLHTLACSYVHLPSEELSARLIPEAVRVGCGEDRSTRNYHEKERRDCGGDGRNKREGQKRGSSSNSSSRARVEDGRGETASSSSSTGEVDSENKEHVSDEERSNVSKGYEGSNPGGLCPTTMWEIALQHIAVSAAYAKMVSADEAAAKERGEVPGKALPFSFSWPGKPVEDVYAHWAVTNLPVGGERAPLPPHYPSAALGGRPTALHVYLVLELLLLSWPDPHVPDATSMSLTNGSLPTEGYIATSRWEWLLLMTALLQQTSTEQKQQVLRERGPLLMQLLYQALLEDQGLGSTQAWPSSNALMMTGGEMAYKAWFLIVTLNGLEEGSREASVRRSLVAEGTPWAVNVPLAISMVLQNLLFESLPESWVAPTTARIGKVLLSLIGKYDMCAGQPGDGFLLCRGH